MGVRLMLINEIFSSIDGEGIRTGYPVTFIRSYGCNLLCSYCDTLYAVKPETEQDKQNAFKEMSVDEILEECKKLGNRRITFTGGEPLIQKDAKKLISKLTLNDYEVNIETNGAVDLETFLTLDTDNLIERDNLIITMDWKSPSSGMRNKMILNNIKLLSFKDVLKFVVGSKQDLDDMYSIVMKYKPFCEIFVSPVFGEIEPKEIVEYILNNNLQQVRVQLQLHKIIYPIDMRGV